MGTERELLRGRWRYDFLQFGVRPHPAEVFVFIDVGQVAIAFFLGFLSAPGRLPKRNAILSAASAKRR